MPWIRVASILALFIAGCGSSASEDGDLGTISGNSLTENLLRQGFRCDVGELGDICHIPKVTSGNFRYSQPVYVLIPRGLRRPRQLLLHLHGQRVGIPRDVTPEAMLADFQFMEQLGWAGARESALVFPVSRGKVEEFETELVPRWLDFTRWAETLLNPERKAWILSGHSRAYSPLGRIVGFQEGDNSGFFVKLEAIILLDATFSSQTAYYDNWRRFRAAFPNLTVYSAFVPGGATERGSRLLAHALGGMQVHLIPTETRDHYGVVNEQYWKVLQLEIANQR